MEQLKRIYYKIKSNPYITTTLLGIGLALLMLLVLSIFLRFSTRHNDSFEVPKFQGLDHDEYILLARQSKLRIEVADSVYLTNHQPGTVIEQNPKPGTRVKTNRRVFVTIVAHTPKMTAMPDVVGFTLRQAKANLEQKGLKIGYLRFKNDLGVNNVLSQRFRGYEIEPGIMIPEGSEIELLLGSGMYGERASLPQLVGMQFDDAKHQIIEASLNIGTLRFDQTIKNYQDTLKARVYNQFPAYSIPNKIAFGTKINLWLTLNRNKIPINQQDTTQINYNMLEPVEEEILE